MLCFDKPSKVLRIVATVEIVGAFALAVILLFAGAFTMRYLGWYSVYMMVATIPVLLGAWLTSLSLVALANAADGGADASEYIREQRALKESAAAK